MFFDPAYFIWVGPGIVLSLIASFYVKSTFKKYAQVPTSRGMTGADVAAAILRTEDIRDVKIERAEGFLSDHYDPRDKTLRLSADVYDGRSVSAAGVAAHEVGHAIQHAEGYAPMKLRQTLVAPAQFGSTIAVWVIIGGIALNAMKLAWLGIIVFSAVVAFQIVTLPVELNASNRARKRLVAAGLADTADSEGVAKVLNAAALTYLAAAITSVLTLLYYISRVRDRD